MRYPLANLQIPGQYSAFREWQTAGSDGAGWRVAEKELAIKGMPAWKSA
jgi:hypothetical protein